MLGTAHFKHDLKYVIFICKLRIVQHTPCVALACIYSIVIYGKELQMLVYRCFNFNLLYKVKYGINVWPCTLKGRCALNSTVIFAMLVFLKAIN